MDLNFRVKSGSDARLLLSPCCRSHHDPRDREIGIQIIIGAKSLICESQFESDVFIPGTRIWERRKKQVD